MIAVDRKALHRQIYDAYRAAIVEGVNPDACFQT
jgi:hypothetical protein